MKKRIMAILLTLVAAVSFTACTREGEDYGDRTLLYVGAYEGGWGTEWLDAVIADFEADNPDIKVLVDGDKKYGFSDLLASIDIGPAGSVHRAGLSVRIHLAGQTDGRHRCCDHAA